MSQDKTQLIGYSDLQEQVSWLEGDKISKMSDDELYKYYDESYELYNSFYILQQVTKTLCNIIYGGFGTPSLRYYNMQVAKDITGEASNACQMMEKTGQTYFKNMWPIDTKWHDELREKFPHFLKPGVVPKSIEKDIIITCDTDSVSGDSLITYTDSKGNITQKQIKDFVFQECTFNYQAKNGTEYYRCSREVFNWSFGNNIYSDYPLSISRHKVTKDKWLLTLMNGAQVETTSDHSMIVFREGENKLGVYENLKKIKVKPNEITSGDLVIYWNPENGEEKEYIQVKSCKRVGKYENEYVYDISMPGSFFSKTSDNSIYPEDVQTFFANNILVHNSNYLTFDYVFESLGLDPYEINSREAVDFIVYFMKNKMDPIYDKVLKKMIEARNGVNFMEFELEAIGGFGIFLAKKKYAFSILWKDGKYVADQKKLKVTGIELKQKAAPKEIRDVMTSFVNTIFIKKGRISSELFFGLCKSVKDRLMTYEIPALSKSTKLNKYEDYVIEDKNKVLLRPKTPVGVRGSANYNHLIQKNNLQSEYPLLKDGMSIKIYYDIYGQPFAYPTEYGYPHELVPKMSADTQIEKMLFAPIKRLVTGLIDGDVRQMGSEKMQQGLSAIFNQYKNKK